MNVTFHRIGLVAGGLALLTLGWWLGRQPTETPAATAPSALQRSGAPDASATGVDDLQRQDVAVAGPTAPADATARSAAANPVAEPLPPADTPVVDLLAALRERARRGDASAACRLASELQRCQNAALWAERSQFMEASAAREPSAERRENMVGWLARVEAESARSEKVCAGLADADYADAFAMQQLAAQARPELRVWAASNPALDRSAFLNDLERWAEYRRSAQGWLEAAAAEGDATALLLMARIHSRDGRAAMGGPPLRDPDDERYLVYARLLEQRGISFPPLQQGIESARARLSPEQLAAVDAEVARLGQTMVKEPLSPEELRGVMVRSMNGSPAKPDCE
jgi:hypothetical protein